MTPALLAPHSKNWGREERVGKFTDQDHLYLPPPWAEHCAGDEETGLKMKCKTAPILEGLVGEASL